MFSIFGLVLLVATTAAAATVVVVVVVANVATLFVVFSVHVEIFFHVVSLIHAKE